MPQSLLGMLGVWRSILPALRGLSPGVEGMWEDCSVCWGQEMSTTRGQFLNNQGRPSRAQVRVAVCWAFAWLGESWVRARGQRSLDK